MSKISNSQESFQLIEFYDRDILLELIESNDLVLKWSFDDKHYRKTFESEKQQLQWILANITDDGLLSVTYTRKNHQGRYFPRQGKKQACLTYLKRKTRNTLCHSTMVDFDMVKSHLSIIVYLIDKYKLQDINNEDEFNKIDRIIKLFRNFDRLKQTVSKTYPELNFKLAITRLLYGSPIEYMMSQFNIVYEKGSSDNLYILDNFAESIKLITPKLQALNLWTLKIDEDKYNYDSSWLSVLCQTIETEIVVGLMNHIKNNHPHLVYGTQLNYIATYEYDGFKLLKKFVDEFGGDSAVIQIINEWLISNNYKFIKFISKSMDERHILQMTSKENKNIEFEETKENKNIEFEETKENKNIEFEESKENENIIIQQQPIEPEQEQIFINPKENIIVLQQIYIDISNKQTEIDALELIDVKELGVTDKIEHLKNLKQRKCEMRDLNDKFKENIRLKKEQEKENIRLKKENVRLEKQKIINDKQMQKQEKDKQQLNIITERKNANIFVDCDNDAIDIIIERVKDLFIYTKGQMYYKSNNKWINDDDEINIMLMNYILESKIYKTNANFNLEPYCQNVKTSKNIREGLLAKLSIIKNDNNLYIKFHSSTKNKLCFNDGVLDFIQKRFIRWVDVPKDTIYTTVIIDRDYEYYFNNPNRYFIDLIENDIMINLFGDKTKLALKFFARSITGNMEDKNFMSYCGNRNCGKGILYALFEWAFKDYIGSFNLENVTCKRESSKSSDLAKENAWLLPLQFVRFAITQETDDNENDNIKSILKISNKVMKSIMSGGDELKGRALYQDIMAFTLELSIGIFGNNEISISGNDSARHHLKFSGVKTFVTQDEYNKDLLKYGEAYVSSYLIKDETLKDKVKTDDYSNAMVYLLYENYINKSISVINDDDDDNAYQPIRASIFKMYDVTGNDKDKIAKDDLLQNVKGDKKKIIAELKQLGCVGDDKCRVTIKYKDGDDEKTKQVQAFKGLKLKVVINENEIIE
jgi:hypothetical protein